MTVVLEGVKPMSLARTVAPASDGLVLLALIQEMGGRVFDPVDIEVFKIEEAARSLHQVRLGSRLWLELSRVVRSESAVFLAKSAKKAIRSQDHPLKRVAAFGARAAFGGGLGFLGFCMKEGARDWHRHLNVRWVSFSVSDYRFRGDVIPADADDLMKKLKAQCGDITFRVEKVVANTPTVHWLDPILWARKGDAEFAIARWEKNSEDERSLA